MNLYVGVTDNNWYEHLKSHEFDEVNFWNPGGTPFRALKENELFLFKLHYPYNFIVGGGFFVKFSVLPPFLAWEAFGEKNGTQSYDELMISINRYRNRNNIDQNIQIGCTILTEPFWFDEDEWIPVPKWSKSIVRGKKYTTDEYDGKRLFNLVQERISHTDIDKLVNDDIRFKESSSKHRLGQGAFRVLVTDAYQRRCAITGEKTLPVLEAAHIIPYSKDGQHIVTNGLLLKSDFHTLFDDGYITVTNDYHVEVSRRLYADYGNGKDYYKYHGQKLIVLPEQSREMPDNKFLEWHNENIYLG